MQLFVGLGNPGARYAQHRHNVGYMAVDRIAADQGFPSWRSKFQGQVAEGRLGTTRVILLKPETFMNLSGQSVAAAARFYKIEPPAITVFHDELDLAPGRLRVKEGGGHAGHNGLRSLHAHLGEGYRRVRIGIGHPGHKDRVSAYVLHDFAGADREWLADILQGISDGAAELASGDAGRFMNIVARRGAAGQEQSSPEPPRGTSAPAEPERDGRSPLQRLVDRFR